MLVEQARIRMAFLSQFCQLCRSECARRAPSPSGPNSSRHLRSQVKALRQQVTDLKKRVFVDSLTKVYSRAYLKHAVRTVRHWSRQGAGSLACLVVDIDDFKRVNDSHGHLLGDQVLAFVGQTVQVCAGRHAIVLRFGGDEFLAFSRVSDASIVESIASKITARVASRRWRGHQHSVQVSVSVGSAAIDARGTPASDDVINGLVRSADEAMYKAKRQFDYRVQVVHSRSCGVPGREDV